jgi:hypothetical protein
MTSIRNKNFKTMFPVKQSLKELTVWSNELSNGLTFFLYRSFAAEMCRLLLNTFWFGRIYWLLLLLLLLSLLLLFLKSQYKILLQKAEKETIL